MFRFRTLFALSAGAILFASAASAQTVEWRGGGYITSLTQACLDDGYGEHEYVSVRFRPKGVGDNGDYSKLSFFHPLFFATSYRSKRNLAKSYKPVDGGGTGSSTWFFENTVKMKAKTTPADVKETTETVRIVGGIKNYGDTVNCNVSFDVNLTKRP